MDSGAAARPAPAEEPEPGVAAEFRKVIASPESANMLSATVFVPGTAGGPAEPPTQPGVPKVQSREAPGMASAEPTEVSAKAVRVWPANMKRRSPPR